MFVSPGTGTFRRYHASHLHIRDKAHALRVRAPAASCATLPRWSVPAAPAHGQHQTHGAACSKVSATAARPWRQTSAPLARCPKTGPARPPPRRPGGSSRIRSTGSSSLPAPAADGSRPVQHILVIGGTGRIGSAAAIHLLSDRTPLPTGMRLHVHLAGRDPVRGAASVKEVLSEVGGGQEGLQRRGHAVSFLPLNFRNKAALLEALDGKSAALHTAGPYLNELPDILAAAIEAGVPAYVDVADPIPYLEAGVAMSAAAAAGFEARSGSESGSGTMAVLSAGAFPGLSNLMAVECASRLASSAQPPQDLDFYYFTAGLGGSGTINLLITNLGFGEPVFTYRSGQRQPRMVAGLEPQAVDFFLGTDDAAFTKVGTRNVWAWPFPEVATVSEALSIRGNSNVKMGTAPELWNVIMGKMVQVLPRQWWRSEAFSLAMARFSEPMVKLTDMFVSETHAIRVDVTGQDGKTVSAVQGHDSFRRCVGQSAAEFTLDLLFRKQQAVGASPWRPGVYLPETLYSANEERARVLERMTSTPGTFSYRVKQGSSPQRLRRE